MRVDLAKYGDPAPELPGAEVDGGVCSKVPWGLSSVISSGNDLGAQVVHRLGPVDFERSPRSPAAGDLTLTSKL